MAGEAPTLSAVLNTLARLHEHKTVGYGNAWRKRGELLSIFTNLARKYDRLIVALDEHVISGEEAILDTAADLCVYAAKYLTWLAETRPAEFEAASNGASADACSDAAGPDALRDVFDHVSRVDVDAAVDLDGSWDRVKHVFDRLDAGLQAQAGAGDTGVLSWEEKTRIAWELAGTAAHLALVIARNRPEEWRALQHQIEAMERER